MGLTAIAGAINTEGELDSRFKRLRDLQVELDCRVLRAYGAALDLGHGFHETRQGRRFTISPKARATVLDLLLALNHERHEAEQQEAPAPKRKVSKKPKRPASEAPLLEML